jgi:hypothetical protein
LLARGLDRVLSEAVTRQLEAKGVAVRTGTPTLAVAVAGQVLPSPIPSVTPAS